MHNCTYIIANSLKINSLVFFTHPDSSSAESSLSSRREGEEGESICEKNQITGIKTVINIK